MNNSSRFWLASWRQLEDVNYISFWLTRILFYTRYFHILFG